MRPVYVLIVFAALLFGFTACKKKGSENDVCPRVDSAYNLNLPNDTTVAPGTTLNIRIQTISPECSGELQLNVEQNSFYEKIIRVSVYKTACGCFALPVSIERIYTFAPLVPGTYKLTFRGQADVQETYTITAR